GVQEGLAEPARDAQQLNAVLVADPERYGHRHDAAEDRGQEDADELLGVGEEQDQLVASPGTDALQVIKDAERPLVELGEGHLARLVLALQVADAVRPGAVVLDELGERAGVEHQRRRSSLMYM